MYLEPNEYSRPGTSLDTVKGVVIHYVGNPGTTAEQNRSYFGKIFHETMGKTPQEFLIHYRMTKACQLLKSTQMSIKDIAAAVGYPNQLHFSRAFHQILGASPRAWRNEHFSK